MKKALFVAVIAAAGAVSAEMKLGVVDMMKLVRNHPSYETNRTLLTSTEKDYKKKLDALKSEVEEIQVNSSSETTNSSLGKPSR